MKSHGRVDGHARRRNRVIDERLICDCCGVLAKVVLEAEGEFSVAGNREGKLCCLTAIYRTEGLAIAAWEKIQQCHETRCVCGINPEENSPSD